MERIGLSPGAEIGGYTVVAPLGAGGMGTVYRAVDGGGQAVALKLLHAQDTSDAADRARLLREVAALQKLRHPAVAAVLDAETDSTEAFLVTELVDGVDLEERVREDGPLDADGLLALASGLRDALVAVHGAGVLHRDLKPSNVLLTDGGPVLIDFGLAQGAEDTRLTSTGLVAGTPGYLAPELLDGDEPGESADWWGWAALLAFAATGRPPFGKGRVTTVLARARTGRPDLVGLGQLTRAALRGALAPEPAERAAPDDVVSALTVVAAEGDRMPRPRRKASETAPGEAASGEHADGGTASNGRTSSATVVVDGADATVALAAGGTATAVAPVQATVVAAAPATTGSPTVVAPVADDGRTRTMPAGPTVPAAPSDEGEDDEYWYDDDEDYDPYAAVEWIEDDLEASAGPLDEGTGYVRPAVPRRWGTEAALGLLVFAAGTRRPGTTLVVALVALLVARTFGSTVEAMHGRRERRGVRSSDGWVAALTTPWHVLRAALELLPAVLVAGSVLVIGAGVTWWFVGRGRWTIGENLPGDELAGTTAQLLVGAAVLLGVALVWWGPASRKTRIGAGRLLEVVSPLRLGALAAVVVVLAAAAWLALPVRDGGPLDWPPLPVPTVPVPQTVAEDVLARH